MNDESLEHLKTKWRGKYRGRQTTCQYLEEIRGSFDSSLRDPIDPDRYATKGRENKQKPKR
jgi:hypothetical protein